MYESLSEGKPGLLSAMIARAETQVMRLACIYALLDLSTVVRAEHLLAALALWDYAEASARYIFGDALGDPLAGELLRALREAPGGLSRTQIRDRLGRHGRADAIERALTSLASRGLAHAASEETGGRTRERWYATEATEGPARVASESDPSGSRPPAGTA